MSANFDVAPTVGPSRTEEDFAGHIAHTIATAPEAPWLFIVAQLNMHKSEALVRLVAEACGIKEDLGEKENRGIVQSMPTRAEFLSDVSHRIRFLYTPKHTSWLNHIELWLSIVDQRGHAPADSFINGSVFSLHLDRLSRGALCARWMGKGDASR